MSTWLYLECHSHTPVLTSEGESGQHMYDLDDIRADIANRDLIAQAVRADVFGGDSHFRRNTAAFLAAHPTCRLVIRDEYGTEHPTAETKDDPMNAPMPDPMLRMTPQKASARMVPADLHPTQSRNKHADVAHMIADLVGVDSAYDSTFDAWLSVQNNYDQLDVTVDFLETADRSPSQEVYRLTVERVS